MKQTRKRNEDVLFLLMHIVFAPEFLPAFDFSLSLANQYSTSNSIDQLGYFYPSPSHPHPMSLILARAESKALVNIYSLLKNI